MRARLRPVPDEAESAIIYGRVSMVGTREEIISPEIQVSAGRDRCTADGLVVADVIVELDASGRSFARAGIRRAIEGVELGLWTVIIVYAYHRFGRNARDALVNIARVEKHGGRVVSVTEPFDPETAIGRYGRTNMLAVAELQSDLIGEGWQATHARRRAAGKPHSGTYRLGYRYVDKTYVVDPDWAPIVAELYRRFNRGASVNGLATWLNDMGAPTRYSVKPTGRYAGQWTPGGVRYFLHTGFAAGLIHRKTLGEWLPASHEPIIDDATWTAFLAEHKRRASMPPRLIGPQTPLSGLVLCTGCGKPMAAATQRGRRLHAYQCLTRDCPNRCWVKRQRVDEAVRDFLATVASDVETRTRAKTLATEYRVGARAERAQLQREVTRLDKALVQIAKDRAQVPPPLPLAVLAQAAAELMEDRERAMQRLDELAEAVTVAPPSKPLVRGLLRDWDVLGVAYRRGILSAMLRVYVTSGSPADIDVRPLWER